MKDAHNKAAEHHESAAKSHPAAADSHGNNDRVACSLSGTGGRGHYRGIVPKTCTMK
jgi:hypothetical protein